MEDMKRKRSILLVILMIVVLTLGHYLMPSHYSLLHDLFRRLYYIPIVYAGLSFGIKGGILTSIKKEAEKQRVEIRFSILNSLQAMPQGGFLRIGLGKSVNESIRIEFKDSGVGMSKDVVERVFEPFFTIKERGAGLGLSIVQRIVERHDGKIFLESKEGVGTVFRLELPCRRRL